MNMNKKWIIVIIAVIVVAVMIRIIYGGEEKTDLIDEDFTYIGEEDIIKSIENLYDETIATCVNIRTDKHFGCGNVIEISDDSVYIATAKHIVEYEDSFEVDFQGDKIGIAKVIYTSPQLDYVIGCIKSDDIPEDLETVKYPDQELLYEESYIFLPFFKEGNGKNYLEGNIIALDEYFPEFNSNLNRHKLEVEKGMSGAGVFDMFGYYQGMVVGGYEAESVSIPSEEIVIKK